ncbi:DUF6233 domain-containing protein [Streptomyces sp. NPDC093509]|uniref:DUF6233 domain-containing protein n=1 Tax=Streptomyces sp. NPDC093509 TaxID=3154982 RepID=UPI003450023A
MVTLPGGQVVRARLHARRRTNNGWQYQVGVLMWQDTADDAAEPVEHRAWVSPAHARPIPGISYQHILTQDRLGTGGTPPRKNQPAWTLQRLPHRPGHPGATLIHVIGCTPSDQTLNREQARAALSQPRAAACRECAAASSLTDGNEFPGQATETLPATHAPNRTKSGQDGDSGSIGHAAPPCLGSDPAGVPEIERKA